MRKRNTHHGLLLLILVLFMANDAQARKKAPEPLSPAGEKLLVEYTLMLENLKREISAVAPKLGVAEGKAFLAAHKAVEKVPAPPKPEGSKMAMPRYAPSNEPYKVAQALAVEKAKSLLAASDAFLGSDALHVKLARCALLTHATPRGLAAYCQKGEAEKKRIDDLLKDDALIVRIMEMGGAYERKYGQAMENYHVVLAACNKARSGVLQQLALGTSLEHPDGHIKVEGRAASELLLGMYQDYKQAYLNNELDPAFGTYRDWEYRFVYPHRSVEDTSWLRKAMRNYRPDHITNEDYKWRYVGIVKSDVPYTSGVDRSQWDDLEYSFMQKIFFKGGICGPRAFMGKLSTAAFGIPTRGARQTGHAAMSRWTPEGWTTVLGASWAFNHWRGRNGQDFFLETQAREHPENYRKVLRSQWLGDAMGEMPVSGKNFGVGGGLWHALAHYRKLAIVEAAKMVELAPTGEELAESNIETNVAAVKQIEIPEDARKIVLKEDGTIVVPVTSCSSPKNTEKIRFMKCFDGGYQVHYSLGKARPELLRYTLRLEAAGQYELKAQVVTLALKNGGFLLRLNRRTMVDIEVPYTVGEWGESKPVVIDLKEGRNSLQFTVQPPNKGLSIKSFVLTPVKK